jgi:hypothetical protein
MLWLASDLGLYAPVCDALWKKGDRVLYFTDWADKAPSYAKYVVGKDYGHLEKILYFWDYVDQADCIVNFDVHMNDAIHWLRKRFPEKAIFGSGLGERLENDRVGMKKWIKTLELPLQGYEVILGVTALREYLKKNPNKYVKTNIFRGDVESFCAKDYKSVELVLDQIAAKLGIWKDSYDFIVEDMIETDVEVGYDGFFNGREFIEPYFIGYEYHKGLYIAHVTDEMPGPLAETMEAFKPLFTKMNYRGALSTEEKIVSPKEHYVLDFCARLANPLSALYPVFIENWREAVLGIAKGKDIKLEIKHKYVGVYPLVSQDAQDDYVKINIAKGRESDVRPQMVTSRNGELCAVKGWNVVAILVAAGDSVDEVITKLKENAKHIDAQGIDKDGVNGIDIIKDVISKGKKVGIPF